VFNSVKEVTEVKKNSMKLRNGISLRMINYSHTPNLLMVEDAKEALKLEELHSY
jgi:hypothetical protein